MSSVKPKKKLGQHFLVDKDIAEKIVDSLSSEPGRQVLEIGPGTGVLTEKLLPLFKENLVAVELDRESVLYLNEKLPDLRLIASDFLALNLSSLINCPTAVIGNFPYNISSQIFFRLLPYREQVPEIVCMIQKEVAERLASPPGNKSYGILSVFLQAWYQINYLFTVKPGAFYPPPKINSAVIRLERNERKEMGCDEELFRRVVKMSFNQRRKVIRNSLKTYLLPLTADELSRVPYLDQRPEQLSVDQFVHLTNSIAGK